MENAESSKLKNEERISDYVRRKDPLVTIIVSEFEPSWPKVEQEFKAVKSILDRVGVRYEVVKATAALELPAALHRAYRKINLPFFWRRPSDGYIVLGGIMGLNSDQNVNSLTITQSLHAMNTKHLLNMGNGVMIEPSSEKCNPEGWAKNVVQSCLDQMTDPNRKRLIFRWPKQRRTLG